MKLHIVVKLSIIVKNAYSAGNTTANQSVKIVQHPVKIKIKVGNSIPLTILNGIDIFINSKNPVSTVRITHIVE